MSSVVENVPELDPNGIEGKPAAESPPSSVVTPNVEPDNEPPAYENDAPQDSMNTGEQDHDLHMDDASVAPAMDATPGPDPVAPQLSPDAVDAAGDDILVDLPRPTPSPAPAEYSPDVLMAEEPAHTNGHNGTNGIDAHMSDVDAPYTPNLLPMSPEASTSYISPKPEVDDDHPPPAKRPRVHSDADKASLANSASPPPESGIPPATPSNELSLNHHRFMSNCIKSLKKLKDAAPFLRPVDPIALNIPHYPSIVTHPMDFSTVERKVSSSNPAKPDSNPSNPRYADVEDFIADVRLVFHNCYTFNGADHAISSMARKVEEVFDRQVKNMPVAEAKSPFIKKASPPPPPPPTAAKKAQPIRRPSTSMPVRRPEPEPVTRPKREIPPPPPKELVYSDLPKKRKIKRVKDDGSAEQLRYCSRIISELFKKIHYEYAHPFYEPVDWMKLNLPAYPRVVKKPMDLSTIKKKLDSGEYPNAQKFADDFKLMIRNCFTFNPAGTPVCQAGVELQRVFDSKWRQMPELRHSDPSDDEDDDEGSDDDRAIFQLERRMKVMSEELAALRAAKAMKEKKKRQEKIAKMPQPLASKPPPKAPKPSKKSSASKPPKKITDDDSSLSFSQKKDLSEAIQALDGVKLEKVIKIIHEGFPEIRDSTEEIEIEIDRLPAPVLTKLYNFVIRPTRPPPPKRSRHGKGTGTGGLKRKSMDEDVEAEKIRQLEQRMELFDRMENGGTLPVPIAKAADSDSDSSSGSDSSGSDSE